MPPSAKPDRSALLAAPALLTVALLMLLPMLIAVGYSFMTASPYGGVERPFTADAYSRVLFQPNLDGVPGFDPMVLIVVARSLALAGAATGLAIALALPLAWWMATRPPRLRRALVLLVTVPFWTNLLIRTYCWVLILRDNGLANQLLAALHLAAAPVPFLYNDGAVLLGLVYGNLPFAVLPIYAALERVDPRLVEAAYDLYASRRTILRHLVLPLAGPGIAAAVLLVFVPALGSFLAPDILGGGRRLMIGTLIQQQFTSARDWAFGSALSTLLMAASLVAVALAARRRRRLAL